MHDDGTTPDRRMAYVVSKLGAPHHVGGEDVEYWYAAEDQLLLPAGRRGRLDLVGHGDHGRLQEVRGDV